jgi:hypothetical protein
MKADAIIMPLIYSELCHLKTWLRYCPPSGESAKTIYIAIDLTWTEEARKDVARTYERCALREEGWILQFIDCGMTAEESFYHKDPTVSIDLEKYPYGQKSGPNIQFFRSMRKLKKDQKNLDSVLLMEVDAFPLEAGWLTSLNQVLSDAPEDTLIAGPRYSGVSKMHENISEHLNGNSVYRIGHADFYHFLDCWDSLLVKTMTIAPWMAYDAVIPWYKNWRLMNKRVMDLTDKETESASNCFQNRVFDLTDHLVNLGGDEENKSDFRLDIAIFKHNHPHALIVHGKCFNQSIYSVRAARKHIERHHPANILVDTLLSGDYESALLMGMDDFQLTRIITMQISKISPYQTNLIKQNLTHE